jgi:hypothetical protein
MEEEHPFPLGIMSRLRWIDPIQNNNNNNQAN